jgi:hypothetical protein
MKLTSPRLTVRPMMIVVAVVGLVLAPASWLYRRTARMKSIAHFHDQACIQALMVTPGCILIESPRSRFHDELAKKYHWAARYPWLPVEPDPPEPEDVP